MCPHLCHLVLSHLIHTLSYKTFLGHCLQLGSATFSKAFGIRSWEQAGYVVSWFTLEPIRKERRRATCQAKHRWYSSREDASSKTWYAGVKL